MGNLHTLLCLGGVRCIFSGLTPGVVELFLYVGLCSVVLVVTYTAIKYAGQSGFSITAASYGNTTPQEEGSISKLQRASLYALMITVNIIAVVGANVAFVTATLNATSSVVTLVQILLSLFKFLWNTFYVKKMNKWNNAIFHCRDMSSGFFVVQTLLGLINNIVVPCLVVAVLSPSCFYSVFDTPSQVNASYSFQNCGYHTQDFTALYCFNEYAQAMYLPP